MAAGRLRGVADDPRARVAAVVAHHERTLLRVARQWSLCHDDALDAYQRALEIFVRRVETVDPATEVGWLKVVVVSHAPGRATRIALVYLVREPGHQLSAN